MSTQTPFETETVACTTNWYTRLACKLQKMVEPLCEKRSDFALNAYEQNAILLEALTIDETLWQYFKMRLVFERLTVQEVQLVVSLWQDTKNQTVVWSSEVTAILAPRLTVWNKLGLAVWKAFSVGTSCSCCWAYRLIAVVVGSFTAGYAMRAII